jgi:hypothetical protein
LSPHGANFSQSATKIVHETRLLRNTHIPASAARFQRTVSGD